MAPASGRRHFLPDDPWSTKDSSGRLVVHGSSAVDWVVISSLATAVGTLVLAAATFSAVRSSNRSARIAEVALQEQRRPLLAPSRLEDPKQKIMFMEGNWVSLRAGMPRSKTSTTSCLYGDQPEERG